MRFIGFHARPQQTQPNPKPTQTKPKQRHVLLRKRLCFNLFSELLAMHSLFPRCCAQPRGNTCILNGIHLAWNSFGEKSCVRSPNPNVFQKSFQQLFKYSNNLNNAKCLNIVVMSHSPPSTWTSKWQKKYLAILSLPLSWFSAVAKCALYLSKTPPVTGQFLHFLLSCKRLADLRSSFGGIGWSWLVLLIGLPGARLSLCEICFGLALIRSDLTSMRQIQSKEIRLGTFVELGQLKSIHPGGRV